MATKAQPQQLWSGARDLRSSLSEVISKAVSSTQVFDPEREYLTTRAPNILEWITRPEFLNHPDTYKFWGSWKILKDFFQLRCPACNTGPNAVPANPWGLSRQVLESEVLLVYSKEYDEDQCPKCKVVRSQFVDDNLLENFRILHLILGQRSGKSVLAGQILTYVEHILACINHSHPGGLQGYLGFVSDEPLVISCVATNANQSEKTIWAKYRAYRFNSPWFKRYTPWLKEQEKNQITPKGMQKWEYIENNAMIKNDAMSLIIEAENSNSPGLRGATRVASFMDEVSYMKATSGGQGGPAIYEALENSCKTLIEAADQKGLIPWLGMVVSISSPLSIDDFGMQLLKRGDFDPKMMTRKIATWDFNPYLPKASFEAALRKDYVSVMKNFGCCPPGAATPFIEREDDFRASAVDPALKPTAYFSPYEFTGAHDTSMLGVRLDTERTKLLVRAVPRFLAVDAGKNFDAFAIACAHPEEGLNGERLTVYDWVLRLLTKNKKQQVFFDSVFDLIKDLSKKMPISRVEFDSWNSVDIIQRIRNQTKIKADERSLSDEDMRKFMRDGYSGKLRMLPEAEGDEMLDPPFKSAEGVALYEIFKLERDPKTDKVYNPNKGKRRGWSSDDCARVVAHAHIMVQEIGFSENQFDGSREAKFRRNEEARVNGAMQGGSSGGLYRPNRYRVGGRGW